MQNQSFTSSVPLQSQRTRKDRTPRLSSLNPPSISDLVSESLLLKNSTIFSKPKSLYFSSRPKKRVMTQPPSYDLPLINTSQWSPNIAKRNEGFLVKKIIQIQSNSLQKLGKLYRAELSLTQPSTPLSNSRENLCKSVLKKLSSKLSQSRDLDRQKLCKIGTKGVQMNKIFREDKLISLTAERKNAGQKMREYFQAYAKIQNERILRLCQKQQQLEQKYSSIKTSINKKMQKNSSKRLSKKDFHFYSRKIGTKKSLSIQ